MNLDPKTWAMVWRFLLILGVIDLPIISAQLSQPVFDWKLLLAGVIGGAAAALEKSFSPQLADSYLPPRSSSGPVPESGTTDIPPH